MLMEGPNLDIDAKYAFHIAMIFVVFMYSGGIPILLPTLGIYLILQFFIDKFLGKPTFPK